LGCGCGTLLFAGCAGAIALAVIFGDKENPTDKLGGKETPADKLAGTWELDRDSGAPVPDQFARYKTFGYQFDKDGTFAEDWDGSVHRGRWRAERGAASAPIYAMVSSPPKQTSETIYRFRPQDKDHLVFNHSGALVPLKRTSRQIAAP